MPEDDRDLPEGVIDADPAGGWEDGRKADGETEERSDAAGSADEIEGDAPSQGADPDMALDADEEA
ncbi:hypothetical protein [Microbacterium sp. SS28]|uniref:hypothetical protein n=1 Tax=Microbacterium sp. SS28 TaxID=2919948 RepID=UPI001FA9EEED|nr:hypothetical protein [Microbacterium sp. SS28]